MPPQMTQKSSDPKSYTLDEMMDRLREGDREKRDSENKELVTRADGTKAMKVRRRKRRTDQPADKATGKKVLFGGKLAVFLSVAILVCLFGAIVFSLLQLARFNSEGFQTQLEKGLSKSVNGVVSLEHLSVTPLNARVERTSIKWAEESSALSSATFKKVKAGVGLLGFFSGDWTGSQLMAQSGIVRVSEESSGQFPFLLESLSGRYDEFFCGNLDFIFGNEKNPLARFRGMEMSLRKNEVGRQLIAHDGELELRGWGDLTVNNGTLKLEDEGGWLSILRLKPVDGKGDITIKSKEFIQLKEPAEMEVELLNVDLSRLLGDQFGRILGGVVNSSEGSLVLAPTGFSESSLKLPVEGKEGELSGLPFLIGLRTVLSDTEFAKPHFAQISAKIQREGDEVRIDELSLSRDGFMQVRGWMSVGSGGELDGLLCVGVHENKAIGSTGHKRSLVFSDPVGGYAWIEVELGGTVDLPEDNWRALTDKAARDSSGLRAWQNKSKDDSVSE